MKLNRLATALTLSLAFVTLVSTGCKKNPEYMTNMPNRPAGTGTKPVPVRDPGGGTPMIPGGETTTGPTTTDLKPDEGIPPVGRGAHDGWIEDTKALEAEAIHFAFDSATVRKDDHSKLENVAAFLKSNPTKDVRVEGNCDKRGTEEYNRALGERRALAAREELVKLGIAPNRIETISYGEDRPADPAENDAAYAKNRRDDFVVLSPPTAAR